MKYLLILSCLLFTSVGWSQEYGEQQKFMFDLIRETIKKNKSAVNSASKTRNWIKVNKKLCEIGGIFDAYAHKKDWYGTVRKIEMNDDGTVYLEIGIRNGNSIGQHPIKESLVDTVLNISTKSMVKFSGYFYEGDMSQNECLDGGLTASPDILYEHFKFKFTDIALPEINRVGKYGEKEGLWVKYYKNGNVKYSWNYKDGKKEGETLIYYKNGQLEKKGNYKDDKKEGEWLNYYKDGQLQYKGNYKYGEYDGEWLNYYKNGQLEQIKIWKNG